MVPAFSVTEYEGVPVVLSFTPAWTRIGPLFSGIWLRFASRELGANAEPKLTCEGCGS